MKKIFLASLLLFISATRSAAQTPAPVPVNLGAAATTTCAAPSNAFATVSISQNTGAVVFTVTTNAGANAVSFWGSGDSGRTWVQPSWWTTTSTTSTGSFQVNTSGLGLVCMEVQTFVSGTVTGQISAGTQAAKAGGIAAAGTTGTVFSVTGAPYNAKPDAQWSTTGTCVTTGGGTTITTGTPFFTSTAVDKGKIIGLTGCGAAGATLSTTIVNVNSTTSAVVASGASTAVTGTSTFLMGTGNATAIQTVLAASATAGGGTVFFPCTGTGLYLVENDTLNIPWRVSLNGCSWEGFTEPPAVTNMMGATELVAGPLINGPILTEIFSANGGPATGFGSKTQQQSNVTNLILNGNQGMQTTDAHGCLYIGGIVSAQVFNSSFIYCEGPGLYWDHDLAVGAYNSSFFYNNGAGMYGSQTENSMFSNLQVGRNGTGGIWFDTAQYLSFASIQSFNNSGGASITLTGGGTSNACYANNITASQLNQAIADAIDLTDCSQSSVAGNTITFASGSALNLGGTNSPSSHNAIMGNIFGGVAGGSMGQTGVTVAANANNNQFIGNSCVNNSVANVTLSSTGTAGNQWVGNDGCPAGIACATGQFAISGGWGTTATVSAASGTVTQSTSQACGLTISSSGSGQAANATITWTTPLGLPSSSSLCSGALVGGTITGLTASTTFLNQTSLSQTAPVFTFAGTPVAGTTTLFAVRC